MCKAMCGVAAATAVLVLLLLAASSTLFRQGVGTSERSQPALAANAAISANSSSAGLDGIFDPATCPSAAPQPRYRPQAVSTETTDCRPGLYIITYALSGQSNTRAVPSGVEPKDWPRDGSVHPASQISFSAVSGYTSLPAPMATPTYYDINAARFGQTTVRVTAPKNGYGPYRLEWLRAGQLFTIIAVRGVTNTGPSGVPLDELGKMADSVG